jgi:hypothetical protein
VTEAIWVGYGVLVATCWIGGVRVLRIALRTHEVSEWGLGVVFLGTGGIGYPLLFLRSLVPLSPTLGGRTFALGLAALCVGSSAVYLFNWRLFRPRSVVAALLCSAGTFVIAWSFLAELLTTGFVWERDRFWLALGGSARMIPFVWGALEALLRATRVGGDAAGVRRLRHYGASAALVAAVYAVGLTSALAGDGASHSHAVVALVALGGIPAAVTLWLAFFPPAGQRRI